MSKLGRKIDDLEDVRFVMSVLKEVRWQSMHFIWYDQKPQLTPKSWWNKGPFQQEHPLFHFKLRKISSQSNVVSLWIYTVALDLHQAMHACWQAAQRAGLSMTFPLYWLCVCLQRFARRTVMQTIWLVLLKKCILCWDVMRYGLQVKNLLLWVTWDIPGRSSMIWHRPPLTTFLSYRQDLSSNNGCLQAIFASAPPWHQGTVSTGHA